MQKNKKLLFLSLIFLFLVGLFIQVGSNTYLKRKDLNAEEATFLKFQEEVLLPEEKLPIVLVNFWASWCLPCIIEMPTIIEFQNHFKGRVTVYGINLDYENEDFERAVKKLKLNFKTVRDDDFRWQRDFMALELPYSLLFVNGKLIETIKGSHDYYRDEFVRRVESALP